MGMVVEIRKHLGVIKERLSGKLSAAAVPADALETARHLLETVVKDATLAAHGLTKDALNRIKTHLVDMMPQSLSPSITTKERWTKDHRGRIQHSTLRLQIVDEAAKEANEKGQSNQEEEEEEEGIQQKALYISPTSSLFAPIKPLSRL